MLPDGHRPPTTSRKISGNFLGMPIPNFLTTKRPRLARKPMPPEPPHFLPTLLPAPGLRPGPALLPAPP
eukprot:10627024-Heterocapsa_arctica.AAC.1